MIGATIREPLTTVLLSEIAPGRSSAFTNVGNTADHVGALSAAPMPTPNCIKNNNAIRESKAAQIPRSTENTN